MTQARYDTVLLTPDIIRNLVAVEHLTRNMTRMLTHIDAAFPAFVEAVQQSMRPGASQGNNGVRSSDVSDRTLAEVMRRSRGYDTLTEVSGLRAEIEGLTRQLEKLITSQRTQADEYDLEQVRKAVRCNGDPTCHSNALRNGLCGPCEAAGWGSAVTQRTGGLRPADGRTGARPKWDALMAASADNLRAGIEQVIREAS